MDTITNNLNLIVNQSTLMQITSLGFVKQTFDAYVDGIDIIELYLIFTTVYRYDLDTDKEMTNLKMVDENGNGMGMIE